MRPSGLCRFGIRMNSGKQKKLLNYVPHSIRSAADVDRRRVFNGLPQRCGNRCFVHARTGIRRPARFGKNQYVLVLDFRERIERRCSRRPAIDESSRNRPRLYRQHRSRRRSLRAGRADERAVVGDIAYGPQDRNGTGYGDRHFQLSGVESVRRSLGEAGRVDALSVQFAGAGRGPFEVFGQVAEARRDDSGRARDRLSGAEKRRSAAERRVRNGAFRTGFARYRTVGRRGYAYVRPAPRRENRDRFRVAGAFYRPQHHRTSGTPPDRSECRPRGFGRERLPAGGGVRYQSVQRNAQCRVRCLCSRYDLFPGHVFPGVPPFGR